MLYDHKYVYFDIETYSPVDLKASNVYPYAEHSETDVLCIAYAIGKDRHIHTWRPGQPPPADLFRAITQGYFLVAHNVAFDALMWFKILTPRYGWNWPGWDAFLDSMAMGCIANLPASLDMAAKMFGTHEKDAVGKKLMLALSKPANATRQNADPKRLHTVDSLSRLLQYCKDDVAAERGFVQGLPPMSDFETEVWRATWRMNRNGVKVDTELVDVCIEMAERVQDKLRGRLMQLTKGEVQKETQRARLAVHLTAHGIRLPKSAKGNYVFGKKDFHAIDFTDADNIGMSLIALYQQLNKSSLAKLTKMLNCLCEDGRIRGMFTYAGAGQTGRWAGRDVQLQNLPRGIVELPEEYECLREWAMDGALDAIEYLYGDPMAAIATLIRVCLRAEDGHNLLVADYSAIEGRALAWLCGEETVLEAYRQGKRMYAVTAAAIFGVTYEQVMAERKAGDSTKDKAGKVGDLACGYGGGTKAIDAMGGRNLDQQLKETIVQGWRDAHPQTVAYWKDCENAAKRAIRAPGTVHTAGYAGRQVRYKMVRGMLLCRLPSGRNLFYRRARIGKKTWAGGGETDTIEYYGVDGRTKCVGWVSIWGGTLVENITQAVARDIMAAALVQATRCKYRLVMTVHDELVAEEPEGGRSHEDLCQLMCDAMPKWADGLPMTAEGFTSKYYMK